MNTHHSVVLDREKCMGCINCIKRCPTEAIRVRNGKAAIISERCIDCGVCIRVCPHNAKKASYDSFDMIYDFNYKVVLPAPSFYAQFDNLPNIDTLLTALKRIGFDDVFEVALAAQAVSKHSKYILENNKELKKPIISSACPVVVKLIRIRFPNLVGNVLPVMAPVELAAKVARRLAVEKTGLKPEEIGIFFVSPCTAKITMAKSPIGFEMPLIDGILSMGEVFKKVVNLIPKIDVPEKLSKADFRGIGWAENGGESSAMGIDKYIAADGIENIIKILEKVENEMLQNVGFIELNACNAGCLGGFLTVDDPYVARSRFSRLFKDIPQHDCDECIPDSNIGWDLPLEYHPILQLDENMEQALKKMARIDEITEYLPGLDCGTCGAPSCRALAEDIVSGTAEEDDCIFQIKKRINSLIREVIRLQDYVPPPFRNELEGEEGSEVEDDG